jgi:predicted enzyme related to lactoylglutathione lyase
MDEVRRFYTETLGFADFVHDPRFNYLRVLTATGASLGFMPPMPGPPEQWRPPREPALYFMVEDVDQACRALRARGVGLQQEPTDMPWMHRVAVLKDPEGRLVMLAQVLKR